MAKILSTHRDQLRVKCNLLALLLMDESGGLSKEEFLVLQEQLITLRNRNYELQEVLQKKDQEIANLVLPKADALQFASKLMNRRDKEKELTKWYETQLDALRMKLITQEEEFRLQQQTLMSELNKVICQNEDMQKELQHFKATGSLYSSSQLCIVELNNIKNALLQHVSNDEQTSESERNSNVIERLKEVEMSLVEKQTSVSALEHELLEYKGKVAELTHVVEEFFSEKNKLCLSIQQQEEEIACLKQKLELSSQHIVEKDDFISYILQCIISISERIRCEHVSGLSCLYDKNLLDKEIFLIMQKISFHEEEMRKAADEKSYLQGIVSSVETCLEETRARLTEAEKTFKKEKLEVDAERRSLLAKMQDMQYSYENEIQMLKKEYAVLCDDLRGKIVALEESSKKVMEDKTLMETRYNLELADCLKYFESEREEMQQKLRSLETSLDAKEEEKALSMKKQAALIKELQRAIREETKRAESVEKFGRCCSEERGWHLIDELDAKSAQTLDGAGSRSVSSASALESDNVELINRLTSLQCTHADALDRINTLESEIARLCHEVEEKNEVIEHWIQKKPVKLGTGFTTPKKSEGVLRKFLSTALTGDDTSNDIKEMNKKLQRMLEETLSKNIILQRDLQTLLERTEL